MVAEAVEEEADGEAANDQKQKREWGEVEEESAHGSGCCLSEGRASGDEVIALGRLHENKLAEIDQVFESDQEVVDDLGAVGDSRAIRGGAGNQIYGLVLHETISIGSGS